jgi:putative transposase
MPYIYKTLSPEEQQEIVQQRQSAGYPLHSPPHPFRDAGVYMISAAIYMHAPIMANPKRLTQFERLLLAGLKSIQSTVTGWVVLPTHYHVLLEVESLDLVSSMLKQLHGKTSHEWNLEDQLTRKRKVWYKFFDRAIRNEYQLNQALNYIHYNPVKHEFAQDVYSWPWSSLSQYLDTQGREWLREKWKEFPPGDYGLGWDE